MARPWDSRVEAACVCVRPLNCCNNSSVVDPGQRSHIRRRVYDRPERVEQNLDRQSREHCIPDKPFNCLRSLTTPGTKAKVQSVDWPPIKRVANRLRRSHLAYDDAVFDYLYNSSRIEICVRHPWRIRQRDFRKNRPSGEIQSRNSYSTRLPCHGAHPDITISSSEPDLIVGAAERNDPTERGLVLRCP